MATLLADENFHWKVLQGLLLRESDLDIVRAQDVGLTGASDDQVLAWAADHDRIVITHDWSTLPRYAYDRILTGKPMPGVFVVSNHLSIGEAINDILLLAIGNPAEFDKRVIRLPI